MSCTRGIALVGFLVVVRVGSAQSPKARADHEHHDEPVTEQLGSIQWATSAMPAAHALFVRGVLYMHNFHYPQAADVFRQAQQRDCSCFSSPHNQSP